MAAQKTVRWLNLISVLPVGEYGITTAEVKRRLQRLPDPPDVHLRTVQRDLNEINDSGLIALSREVRDGVDHWGIDPSFRRFSSDGYMSVSAALSLKMAIEHSASLLPLAVQADLNEQEAKIDQVLRRENDGWRAPWTQKVRVLPSGYQLAVPEVGQGVIEAVYEGLSKERKLRLRYRKPASEATERIYSPIALILRAPRLHLVVSVRKDRAPFVLALHRILKAEILDDPIERPDGFDLDQYIAAGRLDLKIGEPIRLQLRCTPALADHWRDACLGENQVIDCSGEEPTVEVDCNDTAALRAYLLGLGSQVKVVGPESLREWFRHELASMVAGYGDFTY